ncbi:uncharacterized protein PGTG_18336 [Puccinia graminis f. sp. tritici CRL 75-36-700-3]|uniref:No apical meristem-associated C-terminal domain-containing protein n=1 Tax=Puccinia graminis f. sp. tritici (strain CRL 75-36-700-3 / race SCCL) TaxID=418459 RepID=E3L726_PUCGT|nr:uncharacterized protein PGTG_18336 [Puccinia graminis f. sp. tritici CRL 75-36-700-3]EFP92349.2 hypothetical protein PGTG_18336 [Puccinia graminis f. sp. tritici CRL 75-36-700-3]
MQSLAKDRKLQHFGSKSMKPFWISSTMGKLAKTFLLRPRSYTRPPLGPASILNLDHCWGILKDAPKWQATQQESESSWKKAKDVALTASAPSSNPPAVSSPAVIEVEDEESENSQLALGNVCIEGQRAAKCKQAEECAFEKIVSMQKELVQILCRVLTRCLGAGFCASQTLTPRISGT